MRPVLEAARVRVDVDGVPQVDGLSFETGGQRVLVLAGPGALFQAAAGLVAPRHGVLRTGGVAVHDAVGQRLVASAPLDPPLPPTWTVAQYVTWSARLAGHPASAADGLAGDALARLKLEGLATGRLRQAPLHARRAIVVAAAVATGAPTLFLEDPVRGVPDELARGLARAIVRGTEGRCTVVFAARASLASPLAMDADEAVVLDGSRVLAQGAPGEVAAQDRAYAVRIHGRGAAFAELAERRGVRLSGHGASWVVNLGATLQVTDLLDMAAAAEAVIVDLRPLAYAFA